MKVHLIRSQGYSVEDFNNVLNLLRKHRGSIEYVPSEPIILPGSETEKTYIDKSDFEKKDTSVMYSISESSRFFKEIIFPHNVPVLTWDQLFSVCVKFRQDNDIDPKDHVILLSDMDNTHNWFGSIDPTLKNYFIHTSNWGHYFGASIDDRFPISYLIAAWLLRSLMYRSQSEIFDNLHKTPRGCLMDLCMDKTEIILKMRTGDICEDCMHAIADRDVNLSYVRQLIEIIDGLRENILFRQRSSILMQNSSIEIRGLNKNIFLTELGDLQINLNPKEKALYLLYLNHPEGITRSYLVDHKAELRSYYAILCSQPSNKMIDQAVDRLTDVIDNNMNEVMARIRGKFKIAVGEEQAKDYSIVSTPEGTHKILLNRELVRFVN